MREGAYMLRTNLEAGSAAELWAKYMQWTEAEASFEALFHQQEPHVKAHVMAAFLGYALWVTLKHWLKRRAPVVPQPSEGAVPTAKPLTPMKALLSTLHSADIVLPPLMFVRFVCAASPNRVQVRRNCSANWTSAYPSASSQTLIVVRTSGQLELILKDLGHFLASL